MPKEAAAFRKAVSDVLAGKSIRKVAMEWNQAGLKTTLAGKTYKGKVVTGTWNSPRVRRLLVSPRYAGLKTHKGKIVTPGAWPALISPVTHEGLVAYLSVPERMKCTTFERKYIGSGVYRCGNCGGPMRAQQPASGKRGYVCREHAHLVRQGDPLDAFVVATVLEKLSQPDAHLLVDSPDVNLPELQDERAALRNKLDDLTAMFTNDVIDGPQLQRGTRELRSKLALIDSQLAGAVRTSPVAALLAGDGEIWDRWQRMSPALQGQVVDELVTVTIRPYPPGARKTSSTPA